VRYAAIFPGRLVAELIGESRQPCSQQFPVQRQIGATAVAGKSTQLAFALHRLQLPQPQLLEFANAFVDQRFGAHRCRRQQASQP
jgi:hypothetical protein